MSKIRIRSKSRNGHDDEGQLEFAPLVTIPAIMVPQGDGSYVVRPGKPVVESGFVKVSKAAKILGVSRRRVAEMCEEGLLVWKRPGTRMYLVSIESVMERNRRSDQ